MTPISDADKRCYFGKGWIKMLEQIKYVSPRDDAFRYSGRIDFENPEAPVFVYACSFLRFVTNATNATLILENQHSYFENTVGILVDGKYRGKIVLHDGEKIIGETKKQYLGRCPEGTGCPDKIPEKETIRFYDFSSYLDGEEHEITVFKRMDACHYFTFHGILLNGAASFKAGSPLPKRKIEIYGDSVSCGEVSEAIAFCGMSDPEGHNGIYSNSFYSYSWCLARALDAQLHDVAQGGIALQDGEGYFNDPDFKGMLSTYDKIQYQPSLGDRKAWNFDKYTPNVVILAIGQNDAHPMNYMGEDYDGSKAKKWREAYKGFIKLLQEKYPKAEIVLTTTILGHDAAWDRAIEDVTVALADPKVHHFLYSKNGCGTSGHIRRPEAEQMATEMKAFLDSLGEGIWED